MKTEGDAFDDENVNSLDGKLTPAGRSNRGQLISYYKELASRQQRLFIFYIFIFGTFARFLRFDRAGCLVSARFNYKQRPELLTGFLWRYSHLDRRGRGWDDTRSISSPQEARSYVEQISQFLKGLRPALKPPPSPDTETTASSDSNATASSDPDTSLADPMMRLNSEPIPPLNGTRFFLDLRNGHGEAKDGDKSKGGGGVRRAKRKTVAKKKKKTKQKRADTSHPFHTVEVRSKGSSDVPLETVSLVIHQPFHQGLSLFGRVTRAYLAYDITHDAIRVLKDYWRPNHPDHDSEADVLDLLTEKSVNHLPTILSSGDVMDGQNSTIRQTTFTDMLLNGPNRPTWLKDNAELRSLVHHYIVEDLLYPSTSFRNSKELIKAFADILLGLCAFVSRLLKH